MTSTMDLLGLAILLVSIIYTGRQINLFLRIKKRLGKVVYPLTPSRLQRKLIFGFGVVFILLMIVVTYNYVSQGISLNFTYAIVLALVLYSLGRLASRVIELRDKGVFGHLNAIEYTSIKHYTIENRGKTTVLLLRLKDNREFVAVIAKNEIEEIKLSLNQKI